MKLLLPLFSLALLTSPVAFAQASTGRVSPETTGLFVPAAGEGKYAAATVSIDVSHLDEGVRELLEAKYYRRESVRTLAERHQLTEKAIEGRLSRARQQLANSLTKRDS